MANANETSPAKRTCFQCDREADPEDGRCRCCILEAEASEAFWAVIVRHFPEAKFGDLSPERTIGQRMANADAIEEWIRNNVPRHCERAAPPFYVGESECESVYDGEKHWAILGDNQRESVADIEGGLSPEAKATAEFIVRACNAHDDMRQASQKLYDAMQRYLDVADSELPAELVESMNQLEAAWRMADGTVPENGNAQAE